MSLGHFDTFPGIMIDFLAISWYLTIAHTCSDNLLAKLI